MYGGRACNKKEAKREGARGALQYGSGRPWPQGSQPVLLVLAEVYCGGVGHVHGPPSSVSELVSWPPTCGICAETVCVYRPMQHISSCA